MGGIGNYINAKTQKRINVCTGKNEKSVRKLHKPTPMPNSQKWECHSKKKRVATTMHGKLFQYALPKFRFYAKNLDEGPRTPV